ncbi:baseplate J/gp47 family protein [Oscillospiraceae bacterium 50-60]
MKSVDEIYQELLAAFARRAGFTPEDACDLSVRLYAAAAQIQALDIQAEWVLDQSFPQTAQGVYLDRHAAMRGLSRLPASRAVGTLRFSVESPPALAVNIPAGTVCMTADERRFQTTAGATLAAGATYADAPAEALEAGGGGNAVAGAVRFLTACPVAVTACTNPAAFSGGSDAEDDETLRRRVLESYRRLPNGANAAWYEQTAMSHDGVAAARAVGRARGIGTVDVYIAGESGLPGAALLEEVRADLRERREIAVDVAVKAPAAVPVNVSAAIAVGENADFGEVKARAELAISTLFTGRMLGRPVLLAELGSRLYALEGVENCRLSAPAADLAADSAVLPVLGTLTVTKLEA